MVKEILFRVNAGKIYGMGHLSRNLALAEEFSENNFECKFLVQTDSKNKVMSFCRNKASFEIICFTEEFKADNDIKKIVEHYNYWKSFLILDHYNHDYYYQEELKKAGIHWAQFDYKKADQIIADIIINPNFGVKESDYQGFIGSQTKLCVGEKFAIIGGAFKKTKVIPEDDRVLIAMGAGNYPQEIIEMICALIKDSNYRFDLITTQNVFKKKLNEYNNVETHENPENIAYIYARNKIAVVAGGVTTYELAYLNIPMIVVPYTVNQQDNAEKLQELKLAIKYSSPEKFKKELQEKTLKVIQSDLYSHFKRKNELIDGQGVKRIVETFKKHFNGSTN